MYFKNPDILYFLFLLVIPIIVHLFQLRKFRKEYFTNVKFLQELAIQSRKSSTIKKWLLLFTRLLLLTCLILAFAQPYFKEDLASKTSEKELVVILDNSYSMQAKGSQGELLKRSVEELLSHLPEDKTFTLLTGNQDFYQTDIRSIQRELQNLDYDPTPFSLSNQLTKVKNYNPHTQKQILAITDGQNLTPSELNEISKWDKSQLKIQLTQSQQNYNASIDSVYMDQILEDFYQIKVTTSHYGKSKDPLPVALYNQDKLIAKTLLEPGQKELTFTIDKGAFQGYVEIQDNALSYDNQYYFSIDAPEKLSVYAVGEASKNTFLHRIYSKDDFTLTDTTLDALDFNQIEKQQALIINEVDRYSASLISTLKHYVEQGGQLIIIPSASSDLTNLNQLLSQLSPLSASGIESNKKLITKISFEHPVFKNVFEKRVDNFQYPHTLSNIQLSGNGLPILSYQDQSPFLTQIKTGLGSVYVFAGAISSKNSNFLNSPLVVLSFYNMAKSANQGEVQAISIYSSDPYLVHTNLNKEAVIQLRLKEQTFIPEQRLQGSNVALRFDQAPSLAGCYSIEKQNEILGYVGFNYPRTESDILQPKADIPSDYQITSIGDYFDTISEHHSDPRLWKWLLYFGLLFILIEILIQKFIK